MKIQLYDGSRKIKVDTRFDECLYAAPRPSKYSPEFQRQGKDLYIHTDREKKITYYLHLWSMGRTRKDKIIPVSPATAERFLRSHRKTLCLGIWDSGRVLTPELMHLPPILF